MAETVAIAVKTNDKNERISFSFSFTELLALTAIVAVHALQLFVLVLLAVLYVIFMLTRYNIDIRCYQAHSKMHQRISLANRTQAESSNRARATAHTTDTFNDRDECSCRSSLSSAFTPIYLFLTQISTPFRTLHF